jgi:hypothetical protein
MKYPFLSFGIAILFSIIFAAIFSFSLRQKEKIIVPATIEISAIEIDDISESKQEKSEQKTIKNIEKQIENRQSENSEESKIQNQNISENNSKNSLNKALIKFGPLPKIPDHLREEAFRSFAIARFNIRKDGTATVELTKPCANPELNNLLLKKLRLWQFEPSEKESIQDIKVNFLVE